ncbi:hypothetical protein AQUSIP_09770 [Aquicella siphonis]|uniref:L,D-TPase catalytic domain-containing protein n=1 Tax=Aquicella siphonis TaxID=254247 RepID=A0A5E4PGV3_9COXI|nr:L,D-transpeptidase [Aquicella siphonis]VVC75687.1 hypothetical protein AQUSIP_09770 [Aquicella siphonis]
MPRIHCSLLLPATVSIFFSSTAYAQVIEISGSPFDTEGAPVPAWVQSHAEKAVVVYPRQHMWGAYNASGKLVRWGIATAGADDCPDTDSSCRTKTGEFRVYSLGNSNCVSNKYDDAPMPYCMYFNGGQALHGSSDIQFRNASHGCVRLHIDDAKWLRYHFVEGPSLANQYRGTRVIVMPYE